MHIVLAVYPAGNGRTLSPYVCPDYGAYSPDRSRPIKLPSTLLTLWTVLTDHAGEVVTYWTLTQALWPSAQVADADLVRAHVARLRQLLAQLGWPPGCLETVHARGIIFHSPRRSV